MARASSGSTPYLRPNWRASSKIFRGFAVSPDAAETQPEVRQGIHHERRIAGGSRDLDRRDTQSDALGRPARKVKAERPDRIDFRLEFSRTPDCRAIHLDCAAKIAVGLPAGCQPRKRLGREIRAMYLFSEPQRFRRKRLDHAGIQQEKPGEP